MLTYFALLLFVVLEASYLVAFKNKEIAHLTAGLAPFCRRDREDIQEDLCISPLHSLSQ
jgi:hypothetical protein